MLRNRRIFKPHFFSKKKASRECLRNPYSCHNLPFAEEQLWRTRSGDRYFYSHTDEAGSFSKRQLAELRRTTLARLLCDNAGVATVQRDVFQPPSESYVLLVLIIILYNMLYTCFFFNVQLIEASLGLVFCLRDKRVK